MALPLSGKPTATGCSRQFMVDGQRIHRVIGRESDGTTRTQAEEFIDKARQDAKAGRLNLPKGRKLALSFREAADKYLTKLEQEGGKDIPMKRYRLDQHLVPFFGDAPLSKIATFDVERYKKQRGTELVMRPNGPGGKPVYGGETKPATINRELAALSHLLNKAVEWGWLDHKPATIKRLKEHSGRITYLTVEQIERLLKEAGADQNQQIHPFIRIGLDTSMRKNEILGVFGASISTCNSLSSTSRRPRPAPVSSRLRAALLNTLHDLCRQPPARHAVAVSVTRSEGRAHGQSGQAVSPLRAGGGARCKAGGPPHVAPYRDHAPGAGRRRPAHGQAHQRSQESERWSSATATRTARTFKARWTSYPTATTRKRLDDFPGAITQELHFRATKRKAC
jgi:hypothetical protein